MSTRKNPLEIRLKKTDLTNASLAELQQHAAKNFGHLGPMSPEMHARIRQVCQPGGIQHDPEPQRSRTGTILDFAHLNGPERAAEMRASAILESGKKARGETEVPKPTGAAAAILKAGADARKPATAPAATGLAGRIVRAARRVVRL